MTKTILVAMPAYNEGPRIAKVVHSVPKSLNVGDTTFEVKVLVVEDCSKDNTLQEAKATEAIVLQHVINSGAGAATRTALKYALHREKPDFVVTIDADGQHSSKDIEVMVRHAVESGADMVVGNRLHEGNRQNMPWFRRFGNWGLSFISRVLFGITTKDTQSGLRLFTAKSLPIVSEYTIDRFGFCTEMLWLAFRAGLKVEEVPIEVSYSKQTLTKGQNNWGVVELIKDLLWVRFSG